LEHLTNQNMSFEISLNPTKEHIQEGSFDELFLEAVESAFSMLGSRGKQALFGNLESKFGIQKETLGNNLEPFASALEQVFGHGARLIEMQIMGELHAKTPQFKYKATYADFSFVDYVEALRQFM